MSDAGFSLFRLVDEYEGPPLRLVLAGAGSYAARLVEIPGASKVVDSIWMPYSRFRLNAWVRDSLRGQEDIAAAFLDKVDKVQAVSGDMLDMIHWCNSLNLNDALPVSITAAVSSKEQRQGENQAFISVGLPSDIQRWHVTLSRLDEVDFEDKNKVDTKRFIQDRIVSELALSLATGVSSALTDEMRTSGYLSPVS